MLHFLKTGKNAENTSDATATANDILSPKTAYAKDGKITGLMPSNGELTLNPGDMEIPIPSGYTLGGKVNAVDITSLNDYTNCLSVSNQILFNNDSYVKLEYIESTGTQYINTGIIPTDCEMKIKFQYTSNNNRYCISFIWYKL